MINIFINYNKKKESMKKKTKNTTKNTKLKKKSSKKQILRYWVGLMRNIQEVGGAASLCHGTPFSKKITDSHLR